MLAVIDLFSAAVFHCPLKFEAVVAIKMYSDL